MTSLRQSLRESWHRWMPAGGVVSSAIAFLACDSEIAWGLLLLTNGILLGQLLDDLAARQASPKPPSSP